ncbi:MAG: hypothetical protein HY714_06150 [Candidatus Omnitrophica bacterium]|nr:hypothetical protein [Candidatus Omnitrophota bacterium]
MRFERVFIVPALSWFCLLFFPAAASAEELVLKYRKEVRREKKESARLEVTIGKHFFSVSEGGVTQIYDFSKRRIFRIDPARKSLSEISLFAVAAFRRNEFYNRKMIWELLEKSGARESPGSRFDLESLFGVEDAGAPEVAILEKTEGKSRVFLTDGEKAVWYVPGTAAVAPELKISYEKFFRYTQSVHPLILDRLFSEKTVPEALAYRFRDLKSTTRVKLLLESAVERPDQGYVLPEDYRPGYQSGFLAEDVKEAYEIMTRISAGTNTDEKHNRQWFLDRSREAFDAQRFLDAALFLFEYHLQTGDQASVAEPMRAISARQADDPSLLLFFNGLDLSSEDAARAAADSLRSIRRDGLEEAHIVDIMLANAVYALGDHAGGIRGMISVLKKNPYITGVYKDLGQMFYDNYEMPLAWMCWDLARTLAPEHPMLAQVTELETDLRERMAEYF